MTSQKLENLLNLALNSAEDEREKSLNLNVGYDPLEREWDLIIKYSVNLDRVRKIASEVTELQNEYAVIRIAESRIDILSEIPEVEYVENQNGCSFRQQKEGVCLVSMRYRIHAFSVWTGNIGCNHRFGNRLCEYRFSKCGRKHEDSVSVGSVSESGRWGNSTGWIQHRCGVYEKGQIDEALNAQTVSEQRRLVRSQDISGHGTAVAGVAAGNGSNSGGRYAGVAMQSELIVVKLGNPIQEGFPRTTELMMGIDYIIRKALELRMPVAVNISFGNTYGGHDGTTLLERYIDDVSNIWKSVFCIGTGNEAASAGHTSGRIISEGEETIQLAIQSRQSSISIQIWKEYTDQIEISIINPSGSAGRTGTGDIKPHRFRIGQTEILLYYGEPSPYSISQEIYIDLLPVESYLTEGIWRIVLSAGKIVTGQYEMWLPSDNVLNRGTGFLFPTDATTLTIPSSASRAISVGAYDARTFLHMRIFSGRGFTRLTNMVKPDLVAPGVEVMTTTVGGGYAAFTGTSFATPFVTGSAALLMEWGIVRGNDPYLYGEKVKAYLRRGAKKVPGFDEYPNEEVGYGALCTAQSIPKV